MCVEEDFPRWQDMSAQARAQAYSPSTMVGGDLTPFLAAYEEHSAQAYGALEVQTLSYGQAPEQTLDLSVPQAAGDLPLHVFIHGGYWQALSKRDGFFPAAGTCAQGIAFAALDYTLAPAATLEQIVEEVTAALRHLRAKAASLGLDPTRIVVSGSSAGAHLAAMACARLQPTERPAGLILLSGIYDLRPLVGTYVNDPLKLDLAEAERFSPGLGDVRQFPRTLIAWGENETEEFKRQSRWFAAVLGRAGTVVSSLEVPARNHFDLPFDLANDSALGAWLPHLAKKES